MEPRIPPMPGQTPEPGGRRKRERRRDRRAHGNGMEKLPAPPGSVARHSQRNRSDQSE